nr:MAG TPA: hypothetical protein [Caudoviricetes sp.]
MVKVHGLMRHESKQNLFYMGVMNPGKEGLLWLISKTLQRNS